MTFVILFLLSPSLNPPPPPSVRGQIDFHVSTAVPSCPPSSAESRTKTHLGIGLVFSLLPFLHEGGTLMVSVLFVLSLNTSAKLLSALIPPFTHPCGKH